MKFFKIKTVVILLLIYGITILIMAINIHNHNTIEGDVNNNNSLDFQDCEMIKEHILDITPLNHKQQITADINKDGIVNIIDYTTIRIEVLEEIKHECRDNY